MNSDKIILDLCGGSGSWSKPYREAGYKVVTATLPEFDVSATKFYHDCLVLGNSETVYTPAIRYENIYGILAAPPCTEFSIDSAGCGESGEFTEAYEIDCNYCPNCGQALDWKKREVGL